MKTSQRTTFYAMLIAGATSLFSIFSCGDDASKTNSTANVSETKTEEAKPNPEHEKKGIGRFTSVELSPTLDGTMAKQGTDVYDLKCSACHKLTNEKLVGPGWAGVTSRRTPEWVMNFSTNTDEMIDKDPAAQAMLEECMVRMPNQSLSDADARAVYEFMRKNDGVK
jgi:cytochrome c2